MTRLLFSDESFPRARIVHYLCFDETTREIWIEVRLNEVPHVRDTETELSMVRIEDASKELLRKALHTIPDLPPDIAATIERTTQ